MVINVDINKIYLVIFLNEVYSQEFMIRDIKNGKVEYFYVWNSKLKIDVKITSEQYTSAKNVVEEQGISLGNSDAYVYSKQDYDARGYFFKGTVLNFQELKPFGKNLKDMVLLHSPEKAISIVAETEEEIRKVAKDLSLIVEKNI